MTPEEGVIKYRLEFTEAPPVPSPELREINAWRKLLYLTRLIGQDPDRYDGFAYGNISQRLAPLDAREHQRQFVISGTNTGQHEDLGEEHYAIVTEYNPDRNLVVAQGPLRPSSESLTHGTIFDLDRTAQVVIHAHSPHIWRHAQTLNIPTSPRTAAYGTPEMAEAVRCLFRETDVRDRRILAMGGHEDGIVSFGPDFRVAGFVLLEHLTRAFQL